jgi:hypothetical protein
MQSSFTPMEAQEAPELTDHAIQRADFRLSDAEFDLIRKFLLDDPFAFTKAVCGHRELNDRYHRPVSYLMANRVDKFFDYLQDPRYQALQSWPQRLALEEFKRRGVELSDPDFQAKARRLLKIRNFRLYRGSGKSSFGTHGICTWKITRDPNATVALMSTNDDGAAAFCRQIRETLDSDIYQVLFHDRVPDGDRSKLWTEKRLWIAGRTNPSPQWSLEARGFMSSWIRTHFDFFCLDDICTNENINEIDKIERTLAAIRGLYMPEFGDKQVERLHIGTIYGEQDDHYLLTNNPDALIFSLLVPVEVHEEGIGDITERGTPTNPDWHPTQKITEIQQDILSNPNEGPMSWRWNFLLDPTAGGGEHFSDKDLKAARYMAVGSGLEVRIAIPMVDSYGRIVEENGKIKHAFLDPMKDLIRAIGVDPAYSEKGDDWAITCAGRDKDSIKYQLETVAGKGWNALVESLLYMLIRWKPRKWGVESAAFQEVAFRQLLEFDRRFAAFRHNAESIPTNNKSKPWRIITQVAEQIRMNKLKLNPRDEDTPKEARRYKKEDPKAVDNRLDSIAMAVALLAQPPRNPDAAGGFGGNGRRGSRNRYGSRRF